MLGAGGLFEARGHSPVITGFVTIGFGSTETQTGVANWLIGRFQWSLNYCITTAWPFGPECLLIGGRRSLASSGVAMVWWIDRFSRTRVLAASGSEPNPQLKSVSRQA